MHVNSDILFKYHSSHGKIRKASQTIYLAVVSMYIYHCTGFTEIEYCCSSGCASFSCLTYLLLSLLIIVDCEPLTSQAQHSLMLKLIQRNVLGYDGIYTKKKKR